MNLIRKRMDEVRNTLLTWLENVTGFTVVLSGQDFVRPTPPYLSLNIITGFIKIGSIDELIYNSNKQKWILKGVREFVTSIEAYGIPTSGTYQSIYRAVDILGEVQFSLNKPETISLFNNIGIAVVNENEIIDITELLDTEYEPRASYDITLRLTLDEEVDPGEIKTVIASGEFDTNQDGNFNLPVEQFIATKP